MISTIHFSVKICSSGDNILRFYIASKVISIGDTWDIIDLSYDKMCLSFGIDDVTLGYLLNLVLNKFIPGLILGLNRNLDILIEYSLHNSLYKPLSSLIVSK